MSLTFCPKKGERTAPGLAHFLARYALGPVQNLLLKASASSDFSNALNCLLNSSNRCAIVTNMPSVKAY